ncbi:MULTISPECIES: hypothetical protein [unclassified Myroides]|uniref:hypothetical protein n=1 Tax=unclassified Myroides TaxID=2642485 RepID=UPI003D2F70D9
MKKIILSAAVAFTVLTTTTNVVAQQGFGTNTPDRSAAVDIVSSKRGLLIPRIELTKTTEAGPVAKPENSLFVYNKATANDVTPGFYYWEASTAANAKEQGLGRWVRFVSSNSGSAVTVSAGTNVAVKSTTDGRDTDYNVSVKGGTTAGQVLVTEIVEVNGENVHSTKWVNPQDFINGSVVGENGISASIGTDNKVHVGLGGTLNTATTIETTVGVDGKPGNTLAITGLEKLDGSTGKEFNATTQNIVIMGADGILKVVTPEELLDKAIGGGEIDGKALTSSSIKVDANGATALLKDVNIEIAGGTEIGQVLVTKEGPIVNNVQTYITEWKSPADLSNTLGAGQGISIEGNKINLGGNPITSATVLNVEDADASLAIKGLTDVTETNPASNNVVVADPTTGVLKQTSAKELVEDVIGGTGTNELKAKTLKGDGITVTAGGDVGTDLSVANALLKDVTLGIADNAITTAKIADGAVETAKIADAAVTNDKIDAGAVTADKMLAKNSATGDPVTAGYVPVAKADGTVTYQSVSSALGQPLTTDSKIVIGTTNKVSRLDAAVLVPTHLSIKEGSIGTTELTDGAVTAEKMTANVGDDNAPKGSIPVANADGTVTYQQVTGKLLNGKALTSGSISVFGGEKALLDATRIDITGGSTTGDVLVTSDVPMKDADGNDLVVNGETVYETKWVAASNLGNTVTASNGLTKTDNDIVLGGTIDTPTTLAINNTKGSLAITGLGTADPEKGNKTVVVQEDGTLATVEVAAGEVNITEGNITEGNAVYIGGTNSVVNNYHPSMREIVIEVTLVDTDINLNLPAVAGTEGQTISIKIVNTDEDHAGYLNIISPEGTIAYGAMPYQGWIIKSNGVKWIVVGRN